MLVSGLPTEPLGDLPKFKRFSSLRLFPLSTEEQRWWMPPWPHPHLPLAAPSNPPGIRGHTLIFNRHCLPSVASPNSMERNKNLSCSSQCCVGPWTGKAPPTTDYSRLKLIKWEPCNECTRGNLLRLLYFLQIHSICGTYTFTSIYFFTFYKIKLQPYAAQPLLCVFVLLVNERIHCVHGHVWPRSSLKNSSVGFWQSQFWFQCIPLVHILPFLDHCQTF